MGVWQTAPPPLVGGPPMGNLKLRQLARQPPMLERFQINLSNTERCSSDLNRGV